MNPTIEAWIEDKISELQKLIDEENKRIETRDGPGDGMFPNMGTTETLRWHSMIQVLEELQEVLN